MTQPFSAIIERYKRIPSERWLFFRRALVHPLRLGTLVLIGDVPHPSRMRVTHDLLRRQLKICGTQNAFLPPGEAEWTAVRQSELFYHYLHTGQMRVDDLVTHRFAPEAASDVYTMLREDRSGTIGVVFDWRETRA